MAPRHSHFIQKRTARGCRTSKATRAAQKDIPSRPTRIVLAVDICRPSVSRGVCRHAEEQLAAMGCGSSMDASSEHDYPSAGGGGANTLQQWQQLNGVPPQHSSDVVAEFVRLDEQIARLESACPAPRLATAEAWVEHLQVKLNALIGVDGMERAYARQQEQQQQQQQQPLVEHSDSAIGHADILQLDAYNDAVDGDGEVNAVPFGGGAVPNAARYAPHNGQLNHQALAFKNNNNNNNNNNNSNNKKNNNKQSRRTTNLLHSKSIVANTPNQDLANLALNLGVVGDVQKASTHEDFFAQLSDAALHLLSVRFYTDILEHNRARLKTLATEYAQLNELYVNSDGIIAFISGGTYMSRQEEQLDGQLEAARDVRDKLGSALEQWRISGTLLHACSAAATQALQLWRQLAKKILPKEKMQLALACRTSLQASLISLECAQLALPHVELKHVSNRQVLAVEHCNRYIVTDIANLSRYEHSSKVFAAFEGNMAKTSAWLHETYKNTLRTDFEKSDETVRNLAKKLRNHREQIFMAAQRR